MSAPVIAGFSGRQNLGNLLESALLAGASVATADVEAHWIDPSERCPVRATCGTACLLLAVPLILRLVYGALGALIYNVVAKWVGGIEVEVE